MTITRLLRGTALAATLLICGVASAGAAGNDPKPDARPYLKRADRPDEASGLPPPPAAGSAAEGTDRATFAATRALQGTPRWALATADADRRPVSLLRDFSCALGVAVDPSRAPALMALLDRSYADVEKGSKGIKKLYHRARPLAGNDAPVCEPRSDHLLTSFSYPSGHATQGWLAALVLADIAPDRADALRDRGRVYGDSRVVCGSHWVSDVATARLAGDHLFTALRGNDSFRADLASARAELAAARSAEPPQAGMSCAVEAAAAAHPYAP